MKKGDPHRIQRKGRGAASNRSSRFDAWTREDDGDYLDQTEVHAPPSVRTQVFEDSARTVISRNDSPDIPFSQSINPFKGCEHGCVYCYARPTHAYLGLSPGLDFETKLYAKTDAAALLTAELSRPGYVPSLIALGANTDPYQPIERRLKITRAILEVLREFNHPVSIVTKSALVERDLDILVPMAQKRLAQVLISVTTLDHEITRTLEPRTTAPARRIEAIRRLCEAGVPTGVLVGPVIPALTDADLEKVLATAARAGATHAGYVLLRLPREVRDLFTEWLELHYPNRARHVMNLVRDTRNGRDNDPEFGTRMRGTGNVAELIKRRFDNACRRYGLSRERLSLDTAQFRVPSRTGDQMDLF